MSTLYMDAIRWTCCNMMKQQLYGAARAAAAYYRILLLWNLSRNAVSHIPEKIMQQNCSIAFGRWVTVMMMGFGWNRHTVFVFLLVVLMSTVARARCWPSRHRNSNQEKKGIIKWYLFCDCYKDCIMILCAVSGIDLEEMTKQEKCTNTHT